MFAQPISIYNIAFLSQTPDTQPKTLTMFRKSLENRTNISVRSDVKQN